MVLLSTVASLVDSLNVGPLMVDRSGAPVANAWGGYDTPTPATFSINPIAAHVSTGRDLDSDRSADRNSERAEFYTRRRLFVSDGGQAADVITYQGRRYRITQTQNYDPQGAVYISIGVLEDIQQ